MRTSRRVGLCASGIAALLIVLLAFHGFAGAGMTTGEQDDASPRRITAPPATVSRRGFLREIHRALKADDERLTGLLARLLEEQRATAHVRDTNGLTGLLARLRGEQRTPPDVPNAIVNMRIAEKAAEGRYLNSKLTREIAEIAVKEYTEGVYVQDLQTVEGEITLAKSDLSRGRDLAEFAQRDADRLWAQLEVEARSLRLESAELKKKALVEYSAPRLVKELEADVARARIDELANKAHWEMIGGQLERLEKAAAAQRAEPPTDDRRLAFALVSRAVVIEGRIRHDLASFTNATESDASLQKEIRDLTNELGIIVEEAEAAKAASDFARLKARIQQAARR